LQHSDAIVENLNETITWIFMAVNSGRVLSYAPQIYMALRCRDGARSISMATWSYFAVAHITGALYSQAVVHDPRLATVFVGNCVACVALLLVVAYKRRRLGSARCPAKTETPDRLGPLVVG
jgi:hypothetical protein